MAYAKQPQQMLFAGWEVENRVRAKTIFLSVKHEIGENKTAATVSNRLKQVKCGNRKGGEDKKGEKNWAFNNLFYIICELWRMRSSFGFFWENRLFKKGF